MINARAETVTKSRAYRVPFARRRCLVPADGWYEWLTDGRTKQPYFITPRDGGVLAFAGLWEYWRPQNLVTVTVLTTAARGELATVHDRMPLVLTEDRWEAWLDMSSSGSPAAKPDRLLEPPGSEWVAGMELRPVGREVGDVRNNSADLIRPVTESVHSVEDTAVVDLTLF